MMNRNWEGRFENSVELDSAEIRRLYVEEKMSLDKIAARVGSSRRIVTRRLVQLGIEVRARGRKSKYLNAADEAAQKRQKAEKAAAKAARGPRKESEEARINREHWESLGR